jgi:hypothetical protein
VNGTADHENVGVVAVIVPEGLTGDAAKGRGTAVITPVVVEVVVVSV